MLGLDRVALLLQRQGQLAVAPRPAAEPVAASELGAGIAEAVRRRSRDARIRFGNEGAR
jgi:hypothetical protein